MIGVMIRKIEDTVCPPDSILLITSTLYTKNVRQIYNIKCMSICKVVHTNTEFRQHENQNSTKKCVKIVIIIDKLKIFMYHR